VAGEFQARDSTASSTVYVFLRNDVNGQIWNTSSNTLEELDVSNITDYNIDLVLIAGTEEWIGDMPSAPPGRYYTEFRRRLTSNDPAWDDTDKGNSSPFDWDGSAIVNTKDIKAKTDNLPGSVPKNEALNNFMFVMVDSLDNISPKTGLTVTAQISQDGGSFVNLVNSVSEVANGWYKVDLTQAEMNADTIALKFTADGALQRDIVIVTDL